MTNAHPTLGMWKQNSRVKATGSRIKRSKKYIKISAARRGQEGRLWPNIAPRLNQAALFNYEPVDPAAVQPNRWHSPHDHDHHSAWCCGTTTSSGAQCTRFRGAVLPLYFTNLLHNCQLSLARKCAYRMGATPPTAYEWPAPPSCDTMRLSSAAPP